MDSDKQQVLEIIIAKDGDCVYSWNCCRCPFFYECAGTQTLWSKEKRIREAMNLLFDEVLFNE